ncbi:cadherin-like protein 26 isoform X2 [Anabas testudineus]|uniref:cadherin-like protein 26 isoform X2 n=1 Tax=Anabas testudineus TaxID=64144 RepID=UPI000E4635E4|nr:cadherin-like protein 26 isoform X2 [Anabas testudineus]
METIHLSLLMILCFGVDRSFTQILQRRKRNWIIDSFPFDEGYKGPFPLKLGKVEVVANSSFQLKIQGQGVDEEPKNILQIDESTGEITINGPVDHERFKVLMLKFQAFDKLSSSVETNLGIEVRILDSNDNPPRFDQDMYQITIDESTEQGTDLITIKATDVDSSPKHNKFDLRIVSVYPTPHDLEFYLTLLSDGQIGTISFKGCLDCEKAEKYSIIVEAKDRDTLVQLSSSCTVIINIKDRNNHIPVITHQTGEGRVKELQENVLVTRLQVTDKDTEGTEAWKAKYQIQGDTNNNFNITTDAVTNEGLLYVVKHLDYEQGHLKNLTVTVENEIPYYLCKVISRTNSRLWEVTVTSGTMSDKAPSLSTYHMTVIVEDVNEPPIFNQPNKKVQLKENIGAGYWLEKFTAKDPDVNQKIPLTYIKGHDPANLITVDHNTGDITLSKTIDRESHFVKDNFYVVTIYAVDNGEPQMTGTATLSIHIIDENDNAPFLNESTIDICQSNGSTWANITAKDLDEHPYGGPFNFRLLGDVEGKWKVDPAQGYTVKLVKEETVYSGYHEVSLEVSDLQDKTAVHTLTVMVCSCSDTARPNCRFRKSTALKAGVGAGALGIVFLGLLLFAGILLLAFLISCKKRGVEMPDSSAEQKLMKSNTEGVGSDCKLANDPSHQRYRETAEQIHVSTGSSQAKMWTRPTATVSIANDISGYGMSQTDVQSRNHQQQLGYNSAVGGSFTRRDFTRWSMGALSTTRTKHERRNSLCQNLMGHRQYSHEENNLFYHRLECQIKKKLSLLQATEEELDEYAPHVYAEEGDTEDSSELDAISISDISFNADFSQDLASRFNTVASNCMPSESTTACSKNNFL